MLIGRNRGHFFLIFLSPRENYSLLIGRAAKILAPDWLSTLFLHFVGFSFCAATTTTSFNFKLEFDFLSRIAFAKNTWKSSATATEEIPKGELSFPYKKHEEIICVKS